MAVEELRFDITGRDAGASRALRDVAGASDLAARGARVLAESLDKQKRAASASVGATLALAKADKILKDATDEAIAATVEQRIAQDRQKKSAEDSAAANAALGASTKGAASGLGSMVSPMGALVAAGVALAPAIVTLGFGLGGLGVAAAGVVSPILKAAQASGGLAANLGKLDPLQRQAAQSVLGLQKTYDQFQKSLKPVLLADFNAAVALVGPLLRQVQPVAAATGKALQGLFESLNAVFTSGTWRQFFAFMARTAPTDVHLLTDALVNLTMALPTLLEDLQPISNAILQVTDAASKAASPLARFIGIAEKSNEAQFKAARGADSWAKSVLDSIPGLKQISDSITADQKLIRGWFGMSTDAAKGTKKFGDAMAVAGGQASTSAENIGTMAQQVTNLSTAESNSLSTQLAYSNSLLTAANDAVTLKQALQKSHDWIGMHTQAQRDSFSSANHYIADLSDEATKAIASGKGAATAAADIRRGLPILDQAKSKSRLYWQEVQTLTDWLHKLSLVPMLREKILVTGRGQWSTTAALHAIGQGPGPFAAGGIVPGSGNSDSYPALLTPGEVVVPKRMVAAGAVSHLRGQLPGFAGGGLVPSYAGSVAGLQPWGVRNLNATTHQVVASIAGSMAHSFAAMVRSMMASGFVDTGARSGSAYLAQQYAAGLLGRYGWGRTQFGPLLALWNRESGWNAYAVNPSSGAYGIPQSLGHGHPYNLGDYKAQIIWGLNYILGRYGSPGAAWGHEVAYGWYDRGGHLPVGWSLAYNGTGRPEPVGGGNAGGTVVNVYVHPAVAAVTPDRKLGQHIARHVIEATRTGTHLYPAGVTPR